MNPDQIADVLNLNTILVSHHESDAAHNPSLIAALIEWRDGSHTPKPVAPTPVPQQDHGAAEDAAATAEAKAVAAQAKAPPARKAAPAKAAKGRAKPPMVGTRDDNEPSPDPSADDF